VTPRDPAAALAEAAGWGPFFAVATHAPGAGPAAPWRPLREVADDPGVLRDRVARVRTFLAAGNGRDPADVPVRTAASVTHLGLTARLVSPALAVAVLTGATLDLTDAWWQPELGGAFPLSLTGRTVPPADRPGAPAASTAGSVAGTVTASVLDGPVRGLVEAGLRFSVSGRVLWGNVASAVNGAAAMIGRARPGLAAPAADLVTRLLAAPPLRGTGDRTDGVFRRRSCCLIYQAAPPGAPRQLCGDCVLARATL
jgi:hypothetical protein